MNNQTDSEVDPLVLHYSSKTFKERSNREESLGPENAGPADPWRSSSGTEKGNERSTTRGPLADHGGPADHEPIYLATNGLTDGNSRIPLISMRVDRETGAPTYFIGETMVDRETFRDAIRLEEFAARLDEENESDLTKTASLEGIFEALHPGDSRRPSFADRIINAIDRLGER